MLKWHKYCCAVLLYTNISTDCTFPFNLYKIYKKLIYYSLNVWHYTRQNLQIVYSHLLLLNKITPVPIAQSQIQNTRLKSIYYSYTPVNKNTIPMFVYRHFEFYLYLSVYFILPMRLKLGGKWMIHCILEDPETVHLILE